MSFNDASGELTALNAILSEDFVEGSAYFNAQVDKIRKEAYGGAAAGVIFGPLGLAISYGIAAGVVEGEMVPTLRKQLAQVQAAFSALSVLVESAQNNIVDAKKKIADEVRTIGNMKSKTEETEMWVEFDDLMLKQLKKSANSLIKLCDEYIERHSGAIDQG
ncbi:MAG: hemolysin E [Cyanobacteria bacterium P01_C01_bin.72]